MEYAVKGVRDSLPRKSTPTGEPGGGVVLLWDLSEVPQFVPVSAVPFT